MNQLFSDVPTPGNVREEELIQSTWIPAVDIFETPEAIVLKAELPGITAQDISVEVKDNILTLKGEKKLEKETKEENYHRMERSFGSFQRAFTLPGTVQQEEATARFKDGILEIALPKVEEARPRKIKVEISE
jgi:HSP20 family protein